MSAHCAQPCRALVSDTNAIRLVTDQQPYHVIAAEPMIRRLPPLTEVTTAADRATNSSKPLLIESGSVAVPLERHLRLERQHDSQLPVEASAVPGLSSMWNPQTSDPLPSDSLMESIMANDDDLAAAGRIAFDQQEMAATVQRAHGHIQNGIGLAARGALFSARSEFVRSLRVVSDAMDARFATDQHTVALRQGLRALDEAEDFMAGEAQDQLDIDVTTVVSGHRTTVCKTSAGNPVSGHRQFSAGQITVREALDAYYRHANQSMTQSAGGLPVTAAALFGLGKVHASLAELRTEDRAIHEFRAMALYQSSLAVDGRNPHAANELGVLMARYGRHEMAAQLFQQSLAYQNDPHVWRNLSVAMSKIGHHDLAQQARQRAQATGSTSGDQLRRVQWLDNADFAATTQATDIASQPAGATRNLSWSPPTKLPQARSVFPRR